MKTTSIEEMKKGFLGSETRSGYFVSTDKKKVWKVQLDMLESLLQVCQKYGLTISLAAGSLLGAIRHKGFIPWDDDLDVMLPRKDFDRLMDVGPVEFHHPLFFQSPKTDPGYVHAMAKLRNSQTAAIVPKYAQNGRMCNMGIFIDIYPMDPVPASDELVFRKIKYMNLFNRSREMAFSHMRGKIRLPRRIVALVLRGLYSLVGSSNMYELQRKVLLSGSPGAQSRGIGMAPAIFDFKDMMRFIYPPNVLENCVKVPFEYLMVPVFSAYEDILEISYGNWRVPVENASGHEKLILSTNKAYTDILMEEFGYSANEARQLNYRDSSNAIS